MRSPGRATIETVQAALNIYNPDGTPSDDGTVGVGQSAPMTVQLTSPMAVDGKFTLNYDTDYFKVTTDEAGNNVVTPNSTPITPWHRWRHAALPLGVGPHPTPQDRK